MTLEVASFSTPNHYQFVMVWLQPMAATVESSFRALQQSPNSLVWACKVLAQVPKGEAELYTTHTAIVKELNNNSSFHPMALDALRLETH